MRSPPEVRSIYFGLVLAAFALLAALILRPFLSYLLAVALLAFVLHPLQVRLAPRLGPRPSALVLVVVAVAGLVAPVAVIVASLPADATQLAGELARATTRTRVESQLERLLGVDVPLGSALAALPRRIADLLVGDVAGVVDAATHAFLGVVLALFLLYYLLADGTAFVAWTKRMTPLGPEIQDDLYTEAYVTTWAVLKGHVFIAVVQGAVAGLGLFAVGIPHVVFWTVVMMFLELFPVVGVAAVLGPATLYLAFTDRLLAAGFLAVYGLTAVAVVDDYLRAYVVDRESSLHSAVVLLGVFGGVYAFGVMGLFYGPIILGLFRVLVELFREHYVDRPRE